MNKVLRFISVAAVLAFQVFAGSAESASGTPAGTAPVSTRMSYIDRGAAAADVTVTAGSRVEAAPGGSHAGGIVPPPARATPSRRDGQRFAHDRVLVKLRANYLARASARSTAASKPDLGVPISGLRMINPSAETANVNALAKASANGRHNNVYVLTLEETGEEAVKKALEILNANPEVEIAEPVFFCRPVGTPNDPMFSEQYALEKINALQAWGITTGSKEIVVGVIDSGIDGGHPDLIDNLWVNPNPNQNGYVNDIHGYHFVDRVGGVPTDNPGAHGTHVAGIIGAKGDNGVGITGINWNVSIAWLCVAESSDDSGYMAYDRIIEAINYATVHNMPITNNSYGGSYYSEIFKGVIANYPGLFVAAAGNELSNNGLTPSYPANYDLPNVISVAASDNNDMLSFLTSTLLFFQKIKLCKINDLRILRHLIWVTQAP